ncbi:EAL domain-containing protein, partial [Sedimentibacter sp.]
MSIKILIVDDSATDRLNIKNKLSDYDVLTACDGIEAMRIIDEHRDIDMAILNLNMVNMDGLQFLSSLNLSNQNKNLRTLILTDCDEQYNEIKGLNLGTVDYIREPINMDSLKERIDIHLELLEIQHLYEQKLYDQGITFDTIFQQAPIGITISLNREPIYNHFDDYYTLNPMFEKIIGRTKKELIEIGWEKISHPEDLLEDLKYFQKLQTGEINSYSMDKRYIRHDGSYLWAHIVVARLDLASDYKFNHICFIQDISERKEIEKTLEESERSKSVLLSHLPGLAYRCCYDREWTMQYVSDGCFNLTGYYPKSLINNRDLSFNDLISPEYRESLWKEWECILADKLPFKYEYEINTAEGERKWVLEMGQGIYNAQGEVEALEGIILDISDRKQIENNLRYNSEHDVWTGLYNRRYLENLLACDAKIKTINKRAVICINLSAIHSLSLTYGFHYTQELIKKVAESLETHFVDKCQLFNIHENCFAFYIKDYKNKNELVAFCKKVVNTLEAVLDIERIGGGIGIVEIDEDNKNNIEQLLKNLLIASEKALNIYDKVFGVCFFNKEMEVELIREEDIKCEIASILAYENPDSLFLEFQPIFDIKSNKISGFEALARIRSNKLGLIMPVEFIPIAEKTKLIISLGKKIIIRAFNFLNRLKEKGHDTTNVSINISVVQMIRDDFIDNLVEMINIMQINPANITLEITESMFSSNYHEINMILGKLKDLGMKIAIDDFGTGYSSLARERELNIDILKIDKYFSDKILMLNNEDSITADIISMAHKLGHCVIAEGIEHEKQIQYMKNNGC